MSFLPCPDISKELPNVPKVDLQILQMMYERGWYDAQAAIGMSTTAAEVDQ
jgi:hypothetical protein